MPPLYILKQRATLPVFASCIHPQAALSVYLRGCSECNPYDVPLGLRGEVLITCPSVHYITPCPMQGEVPVTMWRQYPLYIQSSLWPSTGNTSDREHNAPLITSVMFLQARGYACWVSRRLLGISYVTVMCWRLWRCGMLCLGTLFCADACGNAVCLATLRGAVPYDA